MILFLYIVIVLVHFDVDFQRSCSIAWEVAWCSDCLFDFRYCVMLGALCLPTYAYHWNCWFGKSKQAMPGSVRLLSMLLQLRDRSCYQIRWIFGKVPIQKYILGTLNRAFMSMKLIQESNFMFRIRFFSNCVENNQNGPYPYVHAFHTIWPSYLLAYMQPYPL